jgi:hypothetical protein
VGADGFFTGMEEIILKKQLTYPSGNGFEVDSVPIRETLAGCLMEEG